MKSKKRLVIAIIIILILVLAIAGAVFAYVYIKTDTFRTDQELFAKYISQNAETLQKFSDSQTIKQYDNLRNVEKFESNTKIKTTYSEGGEVSNAINNLYGTIVMQKDATDDYFYADGQVILDEQKYLESEIIKDKAAYGIRFTDVVKQFVTVKDDNKFNDVASDIGIDSAKLEKIMNGIDGTVKATDAIATEDETVTLKNKYMQLVIDTIKQGKFASNKKAVITYNNNTINTKAYSVSLTSEQVENLLVQILNNLKTEDTILNNLQTSKEKYQEDIDKEINSLTSEKEVPTVRITVYEQSGSTIRTIVEIGTNKVIIENTETNGELKSNIQVSIINSDQTDEYKTQITKDSSENEENINLVTNVTKGDEQYTITWTNSMSAENTNIQFNSSLNYKKDILTASVVLQNEVAIDRDFDKKQELADNNNFVLNDAEENTRKNVIEQLKQKVPERWDARISLLKEALGIGETETSETEVPEAEMTQVDINKFNAKFEFYTGDEVSAENVKTLLNIAKNSLGSYEITPIQDPEHPDETDPDKIKYNFTRHYETKPFAGNGFYSVLVTAVPQLLAKLAVLGLKLRQPLVQRCGKAPCAPQLKLHRRKAPQRIGKQRYRDDTQYSLFSVHYLSFIIKHSFRFWKYLFSKF